MKNLPLFFGFVLLTFGPITSPMAVFAGGCESHINNYEKIKCSENDSECHNRKSKKYDFDKTVKS